MAQNPQTIPPLPRKLDLAGMPMLQWRFTVELDVSATWVMDGYDLTPESLQEELEDWMGKRLGYARSDEVSVKGTLTRSPNELHVKALQGYIDLPATGKAWDRIRKAS